MSVNSVETIEDCENTFNHHVGRMKTILDNVRDKNTRLIQWRFACVVIAFLESLMLGGEHAINIAWKPFMKYTRRIGQLLEE